MSSTATLSRQLYPLTVALAAIAVAEVGAADGDSLPAPGLASPPAVGGAESDCTNFSEPIASFFTNARFSERLWYPWPAPGLRPTMQWSPDGLAVAASLTYEIHPRTVGLGRWVPQSRRERQQDLVDDDDFVGRTFYDVKRAVESLGKRLQLDRSYFLDVELQETTYGTRFSQDPHDVKTVLSFNRLSLSVPIYHQGLTEVSLDLNAGKLYQAVTGKNPLGLRGGLTVKF